MSVNNQSYNFADAKPHLELLIDCLGDENPERTADKLIASCGSASAVFASPKHRLERALGRYHPVVKAICAAKCLALNAFEARAAEQPLIRSRRALINYLGTAMSRDESETVRALFVDSDLRLIAADIMHKGTRTDCLLDVRILIRRAIELEASGIIVAHNHPSGDPTPSREDREMNLRIASACRELDVHFLDNLVVSARGVYSHIWDRFYPRGAAVKGLS